MNDGVWLGRDGGPPPFAVGMGSRSKTEDKLRQCHGGVIAGILATVDENLTIDLGANHLVGALRNRWARPPFAHAQGKWREGAPIPQGADDENSAEIDRQVLVYGGQDRGKNAIGIYCKY